MNIDYEIVTDKFGTKYYIERNDLLYKNRLQAGRWQAGNWTFAQKLIDNWTRCIDIGSNMACSAVQYSERFRHVECFEPTPLNIELWRLTITNNDITNCHLHEVALGECEKTAEIILHEKNGGHNHLNNADRPRWTGTKWAERIPKTRRRASTQVQVKTLDSYEFHDVGFIKLDVEGYEYFVLQGAQETIKANRPTLQLEIRANQCRKFGYWAEDMIEWIRSLDYRVMSKKTGQVLDGEFKSYRNELRYRGEYLKREMDLFFQPKERLRLTQMDKLFEIVG